MDVRGSSAVAPLGNQGVPESPAGPFEELLPELSSALLQASPRDVENEIARSLAGCAELLGVDRASVLQMAPGGDTLHTTHSHATAGRPPFPVIAAAGEFPWLVQQVRLGRVLRLDDLPRGLPTYATPERAFVAGSGVKSYALVPFAIGCSAIGAVALSSVLARGAWPGPMVAWVEVLAQAIGHALARRNAWYALEHRALFEYLFTDLVATFLGSRPEELDARIQHGLERVTSHFGVARCSVVRISEDGGSPFVAYSATAPGIPPLTSATESAWCVARMREGHSARLTPERADLSAETTLAAQLTRGPGAHLAISLSAGGRLWGAIEVSAFPRSQRWTEDEARRLRLVGSVVMEAMRAREAEQQAQQQRDELEHVARVAALGELTAALAHELNQPLMAIRLNAQATRRMLRQGREADVDEVLGDIAEDATRAGNLIGRLRDLLRRRALAKEALDVNEVLAAVHGIARTEARRHGAELVLEPGVGLPRVLGDAIQLQQVVLNLVRNAAEAMRGQAGSRQVRIRTWGQPGEPVTISVEDEGPPIEDAALREMFTPFSTTKAEGLGMGLAISRSIVEAHAGRLWAERRPGGGLAVRLALPAWPAATARRMPGEAPRDRGAES